MPRFFVESAGLYITGDSSFGQAARPHAGHAVFRTNAAIHYSSKALKAPPISAGEAETAEASNGTKSGLFFRSVCSGIGRPVMGPTALLGDNKA